MTRNKKKAIEKRYFKRFGAKIDLNNPETFYEKVNYLKLNQEGEQFSQLIDKNAVKENLIRLGFDKNTTKTISYYRKFKDFKRDYKNICEKHKKFVLKLAHTSGDVFFFANGAWRGKKGKPLSKRYVFGRVRQNLRFNYYHLSFEKIYNDVPKGILIEEYLPSLNDKGLDELKIFFSQGKPVLYNYVVGRQNGLNVKEAFLDSNFKIINAHQNQEILKEKDIIKPPYLEKMINFCLQTCSNFPLVRVDFLIDETDFHFCEFTFYDCGGMNIFYPLEYNKILGDLIKIK